ncbi:MAG: amidase [Deltaproteobacteria bacterium]|nr:amidase [Deltaproteobacteria bacterium]MBW2415005.1 amidase [Deltaproteobacteria bacterium]
MSRIENYESFDAMGLAELVAKGDASPEDLLETAIAVAEERNPKLNAIVIPMYEEARDAIRRGLPEGPFRGVPFLLKDLHLGYTGVRTTYGSKLFEDFVADHDSELVIRYKKAGLVSFGKTHSPEFGLTTTSETDLFGRTSNPWDLGRTAGGSSGGASSAVAGGIVPAANASDGGGSIRIPAACCGIVGLKPTRARNPAGPDQGEGWGGMSTAHVVSRSVRDTAALLDATHGPDVGDPYCAPAPDRPYLSELDAPPDKLRIAVQTATFNGAPTHADCVTAVEAAAALCRELGHEVEEAALDVNADVLGGATRTIIAANIRATVEDRARALGHEPSADDVELSTWALSEMAGNLGAADYARAVRTIHGVGRQVSHFFERYDVLLTPTMATPPLELGRLSLSRADDPIAYVADLNQTIGFTSLFNASGHPAISLPLHWNAAGLPIGLQFAGRFGDEATLLRLSAQLEEARPWFDRTPPR